jgi:chromosome segregation ATPase
MSRPGVTYQDVVTAAAELKGQGKNITIENIRAHLGTGSIGTINKYLRQWRDVEASTSRLASKENLPEALVSLMKGLWEGVMNQSTEQFAPIEVNYNQEISELKQELEKYKNNNQRWQKLFNQWQQEKTQFVNEVLTLNQALEFSHKENNALHAKQDVLLQQLQEKQERIDELHRLHKQTQANLEHYRESAREQRLLDQQQFEQQKQQLQIELKNTMEQLTLHQHRISEVQQQYQFAQQSCVALEKNYAQKKDEFKQVLAQRNEIEKEKSEYLRDSQHWRNQYNELQKILQEKTSQFIDIQTDNKLLSQQLMDAKKAFKETQDQNSLLSNEKWGLAQEKSQLEGQLKQMQIMINA